MNFKLHILMVLLVTFLVGCGDSSGSGGGSASDSDTDTDTDTDSDTDTDPDCNTIQEVRDAVVATPGTVDMQLCDVTVTYVYAEGFFVQSAQEGPAIGILEGDTWTPNVAVGDVIDLSVTELGATNGQQQIVGHGQLDILSSTGTVDGLMQDLSDGTALGEDLEAELVTITNATITALDGSELTVDYGTLVGGSVYLDDTSNLCVGATFDLVGIVTQEDSNRWIQSWDASSDLTNLATFSCTTCSANTCDITGWSYAQAPGVSTFTFPSPTCIPSAGFLVLGRSGTQAQFETYWGVTFGDDVVYLDSNYGVHTGYLTQVQLKDDTGAEVEGLTPAMSAETTCQRISTTADGTNSSAWMCNTLTSASIASPGSVAIPSSVSDPVMDVFGTEGVVISEYSDAVSVVDSDYEFVEIYCDM